MTEIHNLDTTWDLYYHKSDDNNWAIDSYIKIYTYKTVEDYCKLAQNWDTYIQPIQNGMFFIMKENILPLWEDTTNIKGGCWSLKVNKTDACGVWNSLVMAMIGNTLTPNPQHIDSITGLSISPKKGFCIIKIWNSDKLLNDISILVNNIPLINIKETIYKAHQDNIINDTKKRGK